MSRTRTVLVAAVLAAGVIGVPSALAAPACNKAGASVVHQAEESIEGAPVAGPVVGGAVHNAERAYCNAPV